MRLHIRRPGNAIAQPPQNAVVQVVYQRMYRHFLAACPGVLLLRKSPVGVVLIFARKGIVEAVEAGFAARQAGRIPRRLHAEASTPEEGIPELG